MISVVLVEPEVAGNVGAIARVMSNFDFANLVLVRPKCNHLSKEALDRAKHSKAILEKAVVFTDSGLPDFGYLVATTSQLGTDYHILRSPVTPKDLACRINEISSKASIAIVFGPEGQGLSNKDILECDFLVTIPVSKQSPVMNLSHAVAVILYEIFAVVSQEHVISHIRPISLAEKRQLEIMVNNAINHLPLVAESKRETQRRLWKHIIGRSMLSKREAMALMGFLSRILKLPKKKN